MQKVQKVKVMV